MNKLIVKKFRKLQRMRKVKFSEFEQIVQCHSLTSHVVQCQSSCFFYFTKNSECIKRYMVQAGCPYRDT